jgi:hypothetical protein
MVNLAIYGLGIRVAETNDLFKQLSARIFRGRARLGVGYIAAAHAFVTSCRNGHFPASDIDGALFEMFGTATMLDHPYMSSIGARTGFPVIDAHSLETCMVTSYNGAARGHRHSESNESTMYRVLCSDGVADEIRITDA